MESKEKRIASIRVFNVMDFLLRETDTLLDFNVSFPMIKSIDYKSFEKQTLRSNDFEELPRWVKKMVKDAEHMQYYENSFENYLKDRDIYPREYQAKTNKAKNELLFDWLFSNKLPESILHID